MIAQINTTTGEARHFDIRKLSPRECLRLMAVPEEYIDRMMQTEQRTYRAISGWEQYLDLLSLTDSATPRDIREAADEAIRQLTQNEQTRKTMRQKKAKAIGWNREKTGKGNVQRYIIKDVCNCLTTFCGGSGFKDATTGMGNTTPHVLLEY